MAKKQTKPTKPTSGKAWRTPREKGYLLTLPTGNVVKLRPVDLSVMMLDGHIPDFLTPLVARVLYLGNDDFAVEDMESYEKIAEVAPEMLKLYNIVARAAFLEPRIVDDPQDDDEICLDDVDPADKATVFLWVTNGVKTLEFFRDEQGRIMEVVSNGENVRETAVVDSPDS